MNLAGNPMSDWRQNHSSLTNVQKGTLAETSKLVWKPSKYVLLQLWMDWIPACSTAEQGGGHWCCFPAFSPETSQLENWFCAWKRDNTLALAVGSKCIKISVVQNYARQELLHQEHTTVTEVSATRPSAALQASVFSQLNVTFSISKEH